MIERVRILLPLALLYLFLSDFSTLSIVVCICSVIYMVMIGTLYYLLPKMTYKQNSKLQEEYYLAFSEEAIKFRELVCEKVKK